MKLLGKIISLCSELLWELPWEFTRNIIVRIYKVSLKSNRAECVLLALGERGISRLSLTWYPVVI